MASARTTSKRHISFYNKEYTRVCSGINLKSRCTNAACESVRSMGGLVIVQCPDLDTCVYQDVVYGLPCPSCGTVLSPQQFSGVVFVRCEAEVSVADKSELLRASRDETVQCQMEYLGPEIRISVLERESEGAPSPSDTSQKYVCPTNGVNLAATCRQNYCPAFQNNQGLVLVSVMLVDSAVFQELIKFRKCPFCNRELNPASFNAVTFLGCRAEVEIGGKIERFEKASFPHTIKIDPTGPQAVIRVYRDPLSPSYPVAFPKEETTIGDRSPLDPGLVSPTRGVLRKGFEALPPSVPSEVSVDSSGMDPGINFMADCPNPGCGSVVIPSGHIVSCKFKEAIRGMTCPSCHQALPPSKFTGVAFLLCKASVQTDEAQIVHQAGRTAKVCKIHPGGLEVEITVLERDAVHAIKTTHAGQPSARSGSGMEYMSACSGLNIVAKCNNVACLAFVEKDGLVNIKAPDARDCLLSDLASKLNCPSCGNSVNFSQITAITFVNCSGEIIIGDQFEKFNAVGDDMSHYFISADGPEVIINISSMSAVGDQTLNDRKYTKVCDGVNFIAYCANPACLSVQEYNGFVSVKRDAKFIQRGGFAPNRCNYSTEVQQLNCPACGTHLDPAISRGVALVRCKGTIEIAGRPQNFEAKINDFIEFNLDYSDPRTFVEFEVVCLLPHGPGLNVLFTCSNPACPGQDIPLAHLKDVVFIKFGTVTGCKVNEAMSNRKCPFCKQNIPIGKIVSVLFSDCTAVVRMNGKETNYLTGSRVQIVPFELRDNIEVDILPVTTRDVALMLLDDNPFFSLIIGLNVQAICSNQICEAKLGYGGRVCISCPQMKNYELSELFCILFCPACGTPLSDLSLVCLSFLQCKALLQNSEKKYLIEAGPSEVIDFESSFLISDISIQVLSLDDEFPQSSLEGIHKGSEYSHASLCHGLNFQTSCSNPDCVSVQNHQYVSIMSGHLLDFDFRIAAQSLICPCCNSPIFQDDVHGVTMLCCTGEVRIGEKIVKFDYTSHKSSKINIPNDGSYVWVRVDHRTYDVLTHPVLANLHTPFQAVCKGLNFRCYCKNPLCSTVKQREGLVTVKRDTAFADAHRFAHNVCNYREEISILKCPGCSHPLRRYFVWGVLFSSCSGTITRNGSPPEKFSTLSGKVVLYALDRDDTSVRIEFFELMH